MNRIADRYVVVLLAVGLMALPASAATYTKANNANDLDLGTSWVGGTAPDLAGNDTAHFESYATVNEMGANLHWKGITKSNNNDHEINDTPGTSTLTLGSGGVSGGSGQNIIFNCAVVLAANQTWDSGRGVELNGALDNAGYTLTLPKGVINGVISGSGNLIISSATLAFPTINSANTYTGSTTVESGGEIWLMNENALGDSSTRVLNLENGGTAAPGRDVSSLAGANPTPIVLSGTGGRIWFDSAVSGAGDQIETINSDISGTGGLIVDVGNMENNSRRTVDLTLGGSNTYSGATTLRNSDYPSSTAPSYHRVIVRSGKTDALPVGTTLTFDDRQGENGELQTISYDLNGFNQTVAGLTNAASSYSDEAGAVVNSSANMSLLTVSNSANFTYNGWLGVDNYAGATPFPETGNNFGLTKKGSGTLTLTASNSYAGATEVEAGTLSISLPTLYTNSHVTVDSGAFLNLSFTGTNTVHSLSLAGSGAVAGIWGPTGSGAANESALLTGSGFLDVLVASSAPGVDNSTGPTEVSETSATVRGELTNGVTAEAWIVWGDNEADDGSIDDWDNAVHIGWVSEGTPFATTVSGLDNGKSYYYRCYVTNDYGTEWSDASTFSGTPTPHARGSVISAIGVNMIGNGTTLAGDYVAGYVPQTNWNNMCNGSQNETFSTVSNSLGELVTGMSVTTWGWDNTVLSAAGNSGTAHTNLFQGFIKDNESGWGQATITVTNVPYGVYDLYVYLNGTGGGGKGGARVSASGPEYFCDMGDEPPFVDYAISANTTWDVWPSANTLVFSNLTATGFVIDWRKSNNAIGCSGFQIVGYSGYIRNVAPTNVESGQAWLNAELSALSTNYTVYVHCGTTDGGTNVGSWDASCEVGSWTNEAAVDISYLKTGLTSGTTNWYTFSASNDTENIWAEPSWTYVTPGSTPAAGGKGTIFVFY